MEKWYLNKIRDKIILISIFFLISACCAREPYAVPITVETPIATPCHITPPREPDWNISKLEANASPLTEIRAELADLDLSKGYIIELQAALNMCS